MKKTSTTRANSGAGMGVCPDGSGFVRDGEGAPDFQDFFENGSLALHIVGSDGTILHANKSCWDTLPRSVSVAASLHLSAIVESSFDAIVGKDLDGVHHQLEPGG